MDAKRLDGDGEVWSKRRFILRIIVRFALRRKDW